MKPFERFGGRKTFIFFLVLVVLTVLFTYVAYKIPDSKELVEAFEIYATKVLFAVTLLIIGNLGEHKIEADKSK